MNEPKLHHYVPRFYLENFVGKKGQLCVYDKVEDRIFKTIPKNIAAERDFYRLPKAMLGQQDPLVIEKAFSQMEATASQIISHLILKVSSLTSGQCIDLAGDDRKLLSEFISNQYFRTLEFRDILLYLLGTIGKSALGLSEEDKKQLYFTFLSESGLVEQLADAILKSIWIFAKNETPTPFITSDNPVLVTTFDNKSWIKCIDPLVDGNYIVFPFSPKIVLYCKEFEGWEKLRKFDLTVSPVFLSTEMVNHENCGQAFSASRFLISNTEEFEGISDFIPSIGTNLYAPDKGGNDEPIRRSADFNKNRRFRSK